MGISSHCIHGWYMYCADEKNYFIMEEMRRWLQTLTAGGFLRWEQPSKAECSQLPLWRDTSKQEALTHANCLQKDNQFRTGSSQRWIWNVPFGFQQECNHLYGIQLCLCVSPESRNHLFMSKLSGNAWLFIVTLFKCMILMTQYF